MLILVVLREPNSSNQVFMLTDIGTLTDKDIYLFRASSASALNLRLTICSPSCGKLPSCQTSGSIWRAHIQQFHILWENGLFFSLFHYFRVYDLNLETEGKGRRESVKEPSVVYSLQIHADFSSAVWTVSPPGTARLARLGGFLRFPCQCIGRVCHVLYSISTSGSGSRWIGSVRFQTSSDERSWGYGHRLELLPALPQRPAFKKKKSEKKGKEWKKERRKERRVKEGKKSGRRKEE